MTPETDPIRPLAAVPLDEFERQQAMDWIAPEDDSRLRIFLFKLLPVFFLCLFAFGPAWTGGFVWRDDVQVTANHPLRSVPGLQMLWTAPGVTPQWSPLAYSFLWPQHFVWSDKTPVGYHLINLLIHTANAMMVWMLLKRLELPGPFVGALIFALHPLQTESVGWIASQPQLFGTMWGLCFAIIYLRWSGADATTLNLNRILRLPEGPKKLYTLALITFMLALSSAPLFVCTLPLVMAVIVWWKFDRIDRRNVKGLLPFVVLSLAVLIFTAILDHRHNAPEWPYSVVSSLLLIGRSVWFYLHLFIWPAGLSVLHKAWPLTAGDPLSWAILIALVLAVAAIYLRRKAIGNGPIAGIGIILLLLLPQITPLNRVAIHETFISERYQYLACGVMAAMLIAGIVRFARPIVRDARWPMPAAVAVLLLTLTLTDFFGYSNSFGSSTALWKNTASKEEDNIPAQIHLAKVYETKKEDLSKAIDVYQHVLHLTGRKSMEALLGLGGLVENQNDLNEAINYYQEALAVAPDRPEPIYKLGAAWVSQHKPDQAIELFQKTLVRFPKDAELYHLLGKAQAAKGDFDQAVASLTHSIELNPFSTDAHVDLATTYFAKKEYAKVGKEIDEAGKIDPRNYDLIMNLAAMETLGGDFDNARMYYQYASYLQPDKPEPCNNVGFVLTRQSIFYWQKHQTALAKDKIKEAIVYFQKAITIQPDFESAKKNLKTAQYVQNTVLDTPPPTTRAAPSTTQSVDK